MQVEMGYGMVYVIWGVKMIAEDGVSDFTAVHAQLMGAPCPG